MGDEKLRVAFIHPDLGIGGAERLVVDAALGLQRLGHYVDVYTSHHDRNHCFDETRDGTLRVHHVPSPFPRSIAGKLHILLAHLSQLHLTLYLLFSNASDYDVFFVDQLSTCVPFIRHFARRRVVFYCHFPDKLLADGAFAGIESHRKQGNALKRLYRVPMDWLEEQTTGSADVLLANSKFTARVFNTFFNIPREPDVVYPGIDLSAYQPPSNMDDPDVQAVVSERPTLLSLNRFEKKKNILLALESYALLLKQIGNQQLRLVLAGGFDSRVKDNIDCLSELLHHASLHSLTYHITSHNTPLLDSLPSTLPYSPPLSTSSNPATAHVLFVLSFTTPQRAALLTSPTTLVLLYTPTNEHFGIVPVEAMACGLPVLACDSGGPTESVLSGPIPSSTTSSRNPSPSPSPSSAFTSSTASLSLESASVSALDSDPFSSSSETNSEQKGIHTGWLAPPVPALWSRILSHAILPLSPASRLSLSKRAKARAESLFSMAAMSRDTEGALKEAVAMGDVRSDWADVLLAVGLSVLAYLAFRLFIG